MSPSGATTWPAIPLAGWEEARQTFHLYTQVVGKVALANVPVVNHWWSSTLRVTARGLRSPMLFHPTGGAFQIEFDLVAHRLDVLSTGGEIRSLPLEDRSVAAFHDAVLALLDDLGVATAIWPVPVEIADAIPFTEDHEHVRYDPDAVQRFWLALVEMHRVFEVFRSRFVGKSSPVHLFWGALDLAHTRFSGRPAPLHPGGAPNCGPHVMWEAYSREVSSAGYWPGGPSEEGVFYAYAYPDPPGYREAPVGPEGARWDDDLAEFVLPYEAVRTADDPDAVLLEFLQTTYEAAATSAAWDREALERPTGPHDDT